MLPRGTTPTIRYKMKTVVPSDMATCYLTIMVDKCEETIIERDLSTAVIDDEEKTLTWRLTQEETLKIPNSTRETVLLQIRYRLQDGTAGESPVARESGSKILKDGVI